MKKLYTETYKHNYIVHKDNKYYNFEKPCSYLRTSYWAQICHICGERCCVKCFMIRSNYDYKKLCCKDCWLVEEYKYFHNLTQLIYESLFREYIQNKKYMEKSIIKMIVYFALFYQCETHDIYIPFDAQFEKGIIHSGLIDDVAVDIEYLSRYQLKLWNKNGTVKIDCIELHEEQRDSSTAIGGLFDDSGSSTLDPFPLDSDTE